MDEFLDDPGDGER
ncbi:hypothetical protein RRG08_020135, partial [Elysia crispata]